MMGTGMDGQQTIADIGYMRHAIKLARTAAGWTNPNPLVGAVIVKDDRVIGTGCHERFGQAHAERNALASCTENPEAATLYVTLEPCNHTGHQPPCTDAIIEAGVARVVIGSRDPNPLVSGQGSARLRAAGIEVVEDFLRRECDELNPIFFHFITTGRPFVVAKWAMSADGKIACHTGDARWVTSQQARADAHELRHRLAAVCVGIGTVLADDPLLTCRRSVASQDPLRIVCDSQLRIPMDCQLVETAEETPLLIATTSSDGRKRSQLEACGAEVIRLSDEEGHVDLVALLTELGSRGIDSLLVEGGGTLLASMFETGLVDETIVYLAPKIVGGAEARTPVEGMGIERMVDARGLGTPNVEFIGSDLKITYRHGEEGDGTCSPE
jgi:diaminohydroxyphosphoribosylaminopyrimidine deaminase/5-amino-6-(5-phosphoribosylamino)uracil reductase